MKLIFNVKTEEEEKNFRLAVKTVGNYLKEIGLGNDSYSVDAHTIFIKVKLTPADLGGIIRIIEAIGLQFKKEK
jgi:hypothetical protein